MNLEKELQRQIQELSREVMSLRERVAILENLLQKLIDRL
jgi:uncharacterized protein YeeX (DUF496 family)